MFDEQSFEWMFVVPDISGPGDPRIDELNEHCDAVVQSHCGLTIVSTLTTGRSAVDAGTHAFQLLAQSRLRADRTYPDLVTRADIADRAEKTRQAVDNWVRGDRQQNFPSPVHLVGGGVWLWRDVSDWLRAHIKNLPGDAGEQYPTLSDHAEIDGRLAVRFVAPKGLFSKVHAAHLLSAESMAISLPHIAAKLPIIEHGQWAASAAALYRSQELVDVLPVSNWEAVTTPGSDAADEFTIGFEAAGYSS